MTMKSSSLLPQLRECSTDGTARHQSFREIITGLANTDRAFSAAEFATAVSSGMWGVLNDVNVDDRLLQAYVTRWPDMANEESLHEAVQTRLANGEDVNWLLSGLKGKLAEFNAEDWLENNGYTDISFPETEVNPVWDIRAIGSDGQETFFSVKTGGLDGDTGVANYAYDVISEMDANSSVEFIVGSELYDQISLSRPELIDRLTADIGADHLLVEGIEDGLNTLSSNLGIDIPDGVVDIIPYATAIVAGARLIYSVIRTEKDFQAADRTTRNRIQVVQTLTLMSRMGVTTVLAIAGGQGGAALGVIAGTMVPGVGNLVGGAAGGLIGSVTGAGMGMYLNRHLQPHMLNLALSITGLTDDDLFYYKNKTRIDDLAESFSTTAIGITAAPAF